MARLVDELDAISDDERQLVLPMIEAAYGLDEVIGEHAIAASALLFQRIVERRCIDQVVELYDGMVRP